MKTLFSTKQKGKDKLEKVPKYIEQYLHELLDAIIEKALDTLQMEVVEIECEKCHKKAKEVRISFMVDVIKLIFKIRKKVTIRLFYHKDCGLLYVRVK